VNVADRLGTRYFGPQEEQMSIVGPPVLTLARPSRFATRYSRLCH